MTQMQEGHKPGIKLDNVMVHFPMHLDERARSFRAGLRLRKQRRYHIGLNKITFTAQPGERIALVGRNGSGKTTLLRTLSGVYEPDQGLIQRYGKTISLINLSMGMDMYASGIENVKRRSLLYGIGADDFERVLADVTKFSELGDFINEPIRTYSSGMLARLSFGIATAVEADIVLMDEWISAGDARFIERAEERMKTFMQGDKIVFLATHSAALARKWCNRILVLDGGVVRYDMQDVNEGIVKLRELLEESGR